MVIAKTGLAVIASLVHLAGFSNASDAQVAGYEYLVTLNITSDSADAYDRPRVSLLAVYYVSSDGKLHVKSSINGQTRGDSGRRIASGERTCFGDSCQFFQLDRGGFMIKETADRTRENFLDIRVQGSSCNASYKYSFINTDLSVTNAISVHGTSCIRRNRSSIGTTRKGPTPPRSTL